MFELFFWTGVLFVGLLLLRHLVLAVVVAARAVFAAMPVLTAALALIWLLQSLAS